MERAHGRPAVKGIVALLALPECRIDPWCTLTAARVLVHRQAENPVGTFRDLVRRALDGEKMLDPRAVEHDLAAERDAIARNPDLASEGIGVDWIEQGTAGPDDELPDRTPPPETFATYHARMQRESEEAAAEREARAERAALHAKYDDTLCDRLDRDDSG